MIPAGQADSSAPYNASGSDRNLHDEHEQDLNPNPAQQTTQGRSSQAIQNVSSTEPADVGNERQQASSVQASPTRPRRLSRSTVDYDVPDSYVNVPELMEISPVQSRHDRVIQPYDSLEEERAHEHVYRDERDAQQQGVLSQKGGTVTEKQAPENGQVKVSKLATEIYTISYLILFAFFGTLARLGLQALTYYPGAPVAFSSVWPNFAGSLVFGFLAEDRMLFRYEWGTPTYEQQILRGKKRDSDEEAGASAPESPVAVDLVAAKKAHLATKKTIPLYIGLATGFCGSFTSFSSFIRDVFLALSNDLTVPDVSSTTTPRNGGYSFMALLAVIITTVALSLGGLQLGAHLAIALEPIMPSFPYLLTRKLLDRLAVLLAWGSWLGAVLLCALPPDRFAHPGSAETWRGRATFALAFAPLGCLARFYASLRLNGRLAAFPLGTFAVNVLGTGVLGMAWDLAHVPEGGVVGCQVLQGVEDGFCGCLTTVSTWVGELAALRRRHAYFYGCASVLAGLACLVAVMGGLRWTQGFAALQCLH
ncbi:CrcB-like protein-domain-containing protein [Whalleya microplaca]|nr:CrcB-like protein-domain-containing protein [Whalleya microplaca]